MHIKVILADDHVLFRDGFALLLQQHEPEVCCLAGGAFMDALQLLQSHPDTDLLMLDLNMPGMRGATSVREIQQAYPGLPVVILSGEESRAQMEAVLAAGASGYIPKSSSAPVMISAIRLVLAGGVYIPPQLLVSASSAPSLGRPPGNGPMPGMGPHLTERQTEVLKRLAAGKSNKLICRELQLSEGTVKAHINAIYRSLNVVNRTEAAMAAQRLRLIE